MKLPPRVTVLGAAELLAEGLLELLEEQGPEIASLELVDSGAEALGRSVAFRGREHGLHERDGYDFARADLVFLTGSPAQAPEDARRALAAGCTVIDLTGAASARADVPLIVPELNLHLLPREPGTHLIASPGSLGVQLARVLGPLHAAVGLESVRVTACRAIAGAGRAAVEELAEQSAALLSGREPPAPHCFRQRIAFNVLPEVGAVGAQGSTSAEDALARELPRVLEDPAIRVSATLVWVPVFYGDGAAVSVETRAPLSADRARELLHSAPGVAVLEAANRDTVYVRRIREDLCSERGLNLWVAADNVRAGTAGNGLRIAEALVRPPI